MYIRQDEVKWQTKHTMDSMGRMFQYGDRFFRLIYPNKQKNIEDLFKNGVVSQLIEKKYIVKTWIANDVKVEGYEDSIIIEHEKVHFLTIAQEWTCEMFCDAAKMVSELQLFLLNNGYELHDPHTSNVSFIGCRPVYMDLGSIEHEYEVGFSGIDCYKKNWINIIRECKGSRNRYNKMMQFYPKITCDDIQELLGHYFFSYLSEKCKRLRNLAYFKEIKSDRRYVNRAAGFVRLFLNTSYEGRIKKKVRVYRSYRFSTEDWNDQGSHMEWADYHDKYVSNGKLITDSRCDYYLKIGAALFSDMKDVECLEIGGNTGVLSQLLIEKGLVSKICCMDYSDCALSYGYIRCKENELVNEKITFSKRSFWNEYDYTKNPFEARFAADVVFALAITHHLILSQMISIETIIDILNRLTKKYLIIEFMPRGLWNGKEGKPVPEWYSLEWFLIGLKKAFNVINVEEIADNRISIVCESLKTKSNS